MLGKSPKHVGVGVGVAGSDTGDRVIIVHDVEVCSHSLSCLLFLALSLTRRGFEGAHIKNLVRAFSHFVLIIPGSSTGEDSIY